MKLVGCVLLVHGKTEYICKTNNNIYKLLDQDDTGWMPITSEIIKQLLKPCELFAEFC